MQNKQPLVFKRVAVLFMRRGRPKATALTEVRCRKSEEDCALFRTTSSDKADIIFVLFVVLSG